MKWHSRKKKKRRKKEEKKKEKDVNTVQYRRCDGSCWVIFIRDMISAILRYDVYITKS